jgi:hypothetical protein
MTAASRLPFILAPLRFPAALDQLRPNVRHVHHPVEDHETISHFGMTTGIYNCRGQNNITDLPSMLILPLLSHVNDYAINQLVWSCRA